MSQAAALAHALPAPRVDIQTALTILGRRAEDRRRHEATLTRPFRLDLRGADLRRADLSGLHLARIMHEGWLA